MCYNLQNSIPEEAWKSATTAGDPESNQLQVASHGPDTVALRNKRTFGDPESAMIIPTGELATFVEGYVKGDFKELIPTT